MSREFTQSDVLFGYSRGFEQVPQGAGKKASDSRSGAQSRPHARGRIRSDMVVVSAYACTANASGEVSWAWRQAVDLARAGHDVWVVTSGAGRSDHERALAPLNLPNLRCVYWDLPEGIGLLQHWSWGRRLHRVFWDWQVHLAIADWRTALGMCVVCRRVASGSSIIYFAVPSTGPEPDE